MQFTVGKMKRKKVDLVKKSARMQYLLGSSESITYTAQSAVVAGHSPVDAKEPTGKNLEPQKKKQETLAHIGAPCKIRA